MKKLTTLKSHNIYIDDKEWEKVVHLANKRETSAAAVIRDAIKYYMHCRGY